MFQIIMEIIVIVAGTMLMGYWVYKIVVGRYEMFSVRSNNDNNPPEYIQEGFRLIVKPTSTGKRSSVDFKPLSEGHIKHGGVKPYPKVSKPHIVPPRQRG